MVMITRLNNADANAAISSKPSNIYIFHLNKSFKPHLSKGIVEKNDLFAEKMIFELDQMNCKLREDKFADLDNHDVYDIFCL